MSKNILINHENLHNFICEIFTRIGFNEKDSQQCADVLILSDLRGIDSHGCARLSGYVRLVEMGRANPDPKIRITREKYGNFTVDGDSGLGLVIGPFAMKEAIKRSREYGSGWAAVKNSNHFGIGAYHSLLAVKEDLIGFSMTNASPLASPTYSTDRMLGTNPICIAIPSKENWPFVLDMATTAVSNGKLQIAERLEKAIPEGWVQDAEGNPSTDPTELQKGGALLPLGGDIEHSSYKGYGLGSWVDIFCGVLSGANYGPWVPPFVPYLEPKDGAPGEGIGHFLGCWDIEGFMEKDEFLSRMDHWVSTFKAAHSVAGKRVYIPGEKEEQHVQVRTQEGVPVQEKVVIDLENISDKFGVKLEI